MKYIKQLDSIRAIAVLLVIVSHWFPEKNILNILPNGNLGVDIFFVLSGFLITTILLNNKIKKDNAETTLSRVLRNFYWRRSLRIFPIYYLLIFTLLFFHKWTGTNIKEAFVYFATYTSNFYFDMIKGWDGIISHLWSLAVEEQFYFVWPWVILFTNKKFLPHIIIAFIAMGVVSGFFFNRLVTITSFDAFGLGALLAWQKCYQPALSKKFKTWIAYLALGALILLVVGMVNGKWVYLRLRTIDSLLAIYIINYIINNFGSPKLKFKFLLNNRFLIFIGKMSYGVYLYHTIIPRLTTNYLNNHVLFFVSNGSLKFGLHFTINFIVLLVISWFSFIFIERKFLLLKEKFKY